MVAESGLASAALRTELQVLRLVAALLAQDDNPNEVEGPHRMTIPKRVEAPLRMTIFVWEGAR